MTGRTTAPPPPPPPRHQQPVSYRRSTAPPSGVINNYKHVALGVQSEADTAGGSQPEAAWKHGLGNGRGLGHDEVKSEAARNHGLGNGHGVGVKWTPPRRVFVVLDKGVDQATLEGAFAQCVVGRCKLKPVFASMG